jgi:predicted LPLAT superfamily acyltransferase
LRHWTTSFANFAREISDEIYQMEGHLEMTKFEIAFENFSPLRNFNLGRPPTRIRPQKKISLYFPTTFEGI